MRCTAMLPLICGLVFGVGGAPPQEAPATAPRGFRHIQVDARKKQVRVECQALGVEAPLEFFCVVTGTSEHESVLRTAARPSQIHAALLMLGLEPGKPVHFSEAANKWFPPHGPPLNIHVEWERDGQTVSVPAYRLMRNVKTKKPMPALTWIFAGSRVMEDGVYAADVTGYVVSIVNFDLTLIDIPELASNANETLEWEVNPEAMPAAGTAVTMVIEPTGKVARPQEPPGAPATAPGQGAAPRADAPIDLALVEVLPDGSVRLDNQVIPVAQLTERLERMRGDRPVRVRLAVAQDVAWESLRGVFEAIQTAEVAIEVIPGATRPTTGAAGTTGAAPAGALSDVTLDQGKVDRLRGLWRQRVSPHAAALREAAQTQYDVVVQLRREQQRLIDEADRIQRVIDELEREYQEMTTPRPEPVGN